MSYTGLLFIERSLSILTSSCHVCLHSHKMIWLYWLDGLEGPPSTMALVGSKGPLRGGEKVVLEQKNLDLVLKSLST